MSHLLNMKGGASLTYFFSSVPLHITALLLFKFIDKISNLFLFIEKKPHQLRASNIYHVKVGDAPYPGCKIQPRLCQGGINCRPSAWKAGLASLSLLRSYTPTSVTGHCRRSKSRYIGTELETRKKFCPLSMLPSPHISPGEDGPK